MNIQFTKMSGAGNDFVVIDNRALKIRDSAKLALALCDRRFGIGADGVLLLEESPVADFRMMYYNADGSYGGMCGNGGRCIAAFALAIGVAGPKQQFEALGHIYAASVDSGMVTLTMKNPTDLRLNKTLLAGRTKFRYSFVNTGSPHVVVPLGLRSSPLPSLARINVERIGKIFRNHRVFRPEGTNVNFIQREGESTIAIRTYERGVEAETFACGTGSVASAIIASKTWKLRSPITIIPVSKKNLTVSFRDNGTLIDTVQLTGPAVKSFDGSVDVEL